MGNAESNGLLGGAGDDHLRGAGGADRLSGDEGADRLFGGEGDDWQFGGEGDDYLAGEGGDDALHGGEGADALLGGVGDDLLEGGAGDDLLVGGAGADQLRGGAGDDTLQGGMGDDQLYFSGEGDDIFLAGSGEDVALLTGAYGDYQFQLDGETLVATGGGGSVRLSGVEQLLFLGEPDRELTRVDHLLSALKDQEYEEGEESEDSSPHRLKGGALSWMGAATLTANFMAAQAASASAPAKVLEMDGSLINAGTKAGGGEQGISGWDVLGLARNPAGQAVGDRGAGVVADPIGGLSDSELSWKAEGGGVLEVATGALGDAGQDDESIASDQSAGATEAKAAVVSATGGIDDGADAPGGTDVPVTVATLESLLAPSVRVGSVAVREDQRAWLSIEIDGIDAGVVLSVVIEGLPAAAQLSAGVRQANGHWLLSAVQLDDLSLSLPVDSDQDWPLVIRVTGQRLADGQVVQVERPLLVQVEAVADAPTVSIAVAQGVAASDDLQVQAINASGGWVIGGSFRRDTITGSAGDDWIDGEQLIQIPLNMHLALNDNDGSESLSSQLLLQVPGASAPMSLGSLGASVLQNAQGQLYLLVPEQYAGQRLELSLEASSREVRGGDQHTVCETISLLVPIPSSLGDHIEAGGGDDTVLGGGGDDILIGGSGDDHLVGGAGHDALYGGDGDDTLIADLADTVDGGSGDDTVQLTQSGLVDLDRLSDIEALNLYHGDDQITVNDSELVIDAGDGTDTLIFHGAGHAFDSRAFSGFESAQIYLSSGADVLDLGDSHFLSATSSLDGGGGIDTLRLTTAGTYDLSNVSGFDSITTTTLAPVSAIIGAHTDDLDLFLHGDHIDTLIGSTATRQLNLGISREAFVSYLYQNHSDYALDKHDEGDDNLIYAGHRFQLQGIDTLNFSDGRSLYLDERNNTPLAVGDGVAFSGWEDRALNLDTDAMVQQFYDIEGQTLTVDSVSLNGDIHEAISTVQLAADIHGLQTGSYTVSDGQDTSERHNLSAHFQSINDAPVVTQIAYSQGAWGTTQDRAYFRVDDIDDNGDQLSFFASGNGAHTPVRYDVSGNSAYYYVGLNGVGTYQKGKSFETKRYYVNHDLFTVTASDDDSAVSQTLTAGMDYNRQYDKKRVGKPILLDLNGGGLDFAPGLIDFDFDNDGELEIGAWMVDREDGVLAIDYDGDGVVSHGREIAFADWHEEARTDLEGLRLAFDSNRDGLLDVQDERWGEFGVWRDTNGNGSTDPGEFLDLETMDIASFSLHSNGVFRAHDGVDVHGIGQFHYTDGRRGDFADATVYYSEKEDYEDSAKGQEETASPLVSENSSATFTDGLKAIAATIAAPLSDFIGFLTPGDDPYLTAQHPSDSPPIDPQVEAEAIARQWAGLVNQLATQALSDSEPALPIEQLPDYGSVDEHELV